MKVPGAERAFVDIAKLRDYSLNSIHKEGRHKARVFAAALDLAEEDAEWLRQILLEVVCQHDCQLGRRTEFGQRYVVDFALAQAGRRAQVRSVWNIRPEEDFPRLITCYVL
jgi:hypothetical protein